MKKPFWLLILLFASCYKDSDPSGAINGTYNGIYLQSGDFADTAYVQIVFVGNGFSGESRGNSRGICNGTYRTFIDSISFTNFCSSNPADVLLVGNYQLRQTGDSLYLTRNLTVNTEISNQQFSLRK